MNKEDKIKKINEELEELREEGISRGEISDGYHSFGELYYHRMVLFAVICSHNKDKAWKSLKHDDGSMYKDHFIVGIDTPEGQYTYHYHIKHWDMYDVKELNKAPKYDGHKPEDITRLLGLQKNINNGKERVKNGYFKEII